MIVKQNDQWKIVIPCADGKHDWRFIYAHKNESHSRDEVHQCAGCLIVRHRYSHPLSPGFETIHHSPDGLPVAN